MTTATPTAPTIETAPTAASHAFDLPNLEEKRLDCLIARIREGRIDDVVMNHLEVDGVLQLDPLLELGGCGETRV